MIVYAIFKESGFRHECGGIFATQGAAERAARAIVANEDGHHTVRVYPFPFDVPCPLEVPNPGASYNWAGVIEPKALVEFSKQKESRYRPTDPTIRREEL